MWNSVEDTKMNKTWLSPSRNLLTTLDWNGTSSLVLYSPKPPTVLSSIPTKRKENWRFNPHWFSCLFCGFRFADFKIWSLLHYFLKQAAVFERESLSRSFCNHVCALAEDFFLSPFYKTVILDISLEWKLFLQGGSQLFASWHLGFHRLYQM